MTTLSLIWLHIQILATLAVAELLLYCVSRGVVELLNRCRRTTEAWADSRRFEQAIARRKSSRFVNLCKHNEARVAT